MVAESQESLLTEQQQATMGEVRARLSAGHTLQRVAWFSGVNAEALGRLLSGFPVGQWGGSSDDPETCLLYTSDAADE